jgi:hypothetical protein
MRTVWTTLLLFLCITAGLNRSATAIGIVLTNTRSTGSTHHYPITRKKKRYTSASDSHLTGRDREAVAKPRIKREPDGNINASEQGAVGESGAEGRSESETGSDGKYQTPEKQM